MKVTTLKPHLLILIAVIVFAFFNEVRASTKYPPNSKVELFNGENLAGWYTYLKNQGRDKDPNNVFTVEDGILHITGEEWGCITSNDEYENYLLTLEYKWGENTHSPRLKQARDGGVLIHSKGRDGAFGGTWMNSIECQIIEGGTGDVLVVGDNSDEFSVTSTIQSDFEKGYYFKPAGSKEVTINKGRINWFDRDPEWKDVLGFRGKKDIENPLGEWNTLEIISVEGDVKIFLNNILVNHVFDVNPRKGRIQIQSEGAEMFFKKIELLEFPADYRFSYNSDANNMFIKEVDTPAKMYPFIDEAAEIGATSFFISPNWGMPMNYPTEVGDMIGEHISPELEKTVEQPVLNLRKLVADGHDPLKIILDRAKAHKMETFVSFRLNEVHGVELEDHIIFDRFWREHPEWHIGKAGDPMSQLYWDIVDPRTHPIVASWLPGGLDFAIPEVRAYRLAQIKELCERYDVDGIELDFQRFPMFFKPGAEEAGREIMTEWLLEVRNMINEVGQKKGLPIKLVARLLTTPERNLGVGLDPVKWINNGLFDFVTVAHYLHNMFQLPINQFRDILPENFPIYSSIEVEPNMSMYRNIAAPLWEQAINGIYLFNFFTSRESNNPPPFNSIREIAYPIVPSDTLLLVLNRYSNSLSYIDLDNFELIKTTEIGSNPWDITITPNQETAFISNFQPNNKRSDNKIFAVDLSEDKELKELATSYYGQIGAAAMAPDGRYAYFASEFLGYVIEIETHSNKTTRQIPIQGRSPRKVIVSSDGKYLITLNSESGDISVVNRYTEHLEKRIQIGVGITDMSLTPDKRELWVTDPIKETITIIDMNTYNQTGSFKCQGSPVKINFTKDGENVLVAGGENEGEIIVVDALSKKEINRIKVGNHIADLEVSLDRDLLFVSCLGYDPSLVRNTNLINTTQNRNTSGIYIVDLNKAEVVKRIETGIGTSAMEIWRPVLND